MEIKQEKRHEKTTAQDHQDSTLQASNFAAGAERKSASANDGSKAGGGAGDLSQLEVPKSPSRAELQAELKQKSAMTAASQESADKSKLREKK